MPKQSDISSCQNCGEEVPESELQWVEDLETGEEVEQWCKSCIDNEALH